MPQNTQPGSERLYPVKALVMRADDREIIRPSSEYGLTYSGEVSRVGGIAVRNLLQESYNFPSLSIVAQLGIEDGVHGYLFRPASHQRLNRDFTWTVESTDRLRERIEKTPEEFDPLDVHFLLKSLNRHNHLRQASTQGPLLPSHTA